MSDPQHPPEKVEIKANVSDEDAESAAEAVGLRPRAAERRSIWFAESGIGLDAGRLALDARGIIIRLRKVIDGPDDCTVKLRGPQAPALSRYWAERFEIEGDWSGEKHLFSASLVAEVPAGRVDRAAESSDLSPVFDEDQRRYLEQECRPPIDLADLRPLGPIAALKWKSVRIPGRDDLHAEQWELAGLRFLEFSIRVDWSDRKKSQDTFQKVLRDKGIRLDRVQAPKTARVLRRLAGLPDDG